MFTYILICRMAPYLPKMSYLHAQAIKENEQSDGRWLVVDYCCALWCPYFVSLFKRVEELSH